MESSKEGVSSQQSEVGNKRLLLNDNLLPESRKPKAESQYADGTYTFYLEEFDVEPGDIISYYAHATDNNTRTGPGENSSDIYFIEIRPFNEDFHEGEGEPGQPAEPNPLTEVISSQRQIIRETWKHANAQSTTSEEYRSAVKKTA